MKHIIILGAGITGLATAWYLERLAKQPLKITILEKEHRGGGWIRTIEKGGFLFELGPRGFRPSGKGNKTLELVHALGLQEELLDAHPQAKKRYLWTDGKLSPFCLSFLIKKGLLKAFWKDFWTPSLKGEDESIESFFLRRWNQEGIDTIIDPLVKGIFGGSPSQLSMHSCFPTFVLWEKKYRSLFQGFLTQRKQKSRASLCSFQGGMERLPKTLMAKISAEILFGKNVQKITQEGEVEVDGETFYADHIISTLPASALTTLIPNTFFNHLPFLSLTTVNLGYYHSTLKEQGFGYLIPSKEKEEIMGMTWDSQVFPHQNKPGETRLCVMLAGEREEGEALTLASYAAQKHLNITVAPDVSHVHSCKHAIPQYPVGYQNHLNHFHFPKLSLAGSSYDGVGVNDCIASAEKAALHLQTIINED